MENDSLLLYYLRLLYNVGEEIKVKSLNFWSVCLMNVKIDEWIEIINKRYKG